MSRTKGAILNAKSRKSRENERVFVQHVLELLDDLGNVRSRAMFGGYGIYCDDIMIALVADSVLYFKVDATSQPLFEAEQCGPFEYYREGRDAPIIMSYYEAPASALERKSELCKWGRLAHKAAQRANKK
jgi:DNA transformation protein